eukprot:1891699-Alexandrium_andersonii.AAC.1
MRVACPLQKALPGAADASPCSLPHDLEWQVGHLIGSPWVRSEGFCEVKLSVASQLVRRCGRRLS